MQFFIHFRAWIIHFLETDENCRTLMYVHIYMLTWESDPEPDQQVELLLSGTILASVLKIKL